MKNLSYISGLPSRDTPCFRKSCCANVSNGCPRSNLDSPYTTCVKKDRVSVLGRGVRSKTFWKYSRPAIHKRRPHFAHLARRNGAAQIPHCSCSGRLESSTYQQSCQKFVCGK